MSPDSPAPTIARLVATFQCPRTCAGCCNTYATVMAHAAPLTDYAPLAGYAIVLITGGEPMLAPARVVRAARAIRRLSPATLIYLYTARHASDDDLAQVLPHVDGVQFSLHGEATPQDVADFHAFQAAIRPWRAAKSFRLYIDARMAHPVQVDAACWTRYERKPWLTEVELLAQQPGGLPPGEALFVVDPDLWCAALPADRVVGEGFPVPAR